MFFFFFFYGVFFEVVFSLSCFFCKTCFFLCLFVFPGDFLELLLCCFRELTVYFWCFYICLALHKEPSRDCCCGWGLVRVRWDVVLFLLCLFLPLVGKDASRVGVSGKAQEIEIPSIIPKRSKGETPNGTVKNPMAEGG